MSNLQKIRTGSTGSLTSREREALQELVKEYNSDFRVQASLVPFVGDILPEAGVIVVSEHDGRQYYADRFGWHQAGAAYSPVTFFVDFDGTNQAGLVFKLPSTNTITLNWGDGTSEDVIGQDDTQISKTSTYDSVGVKYFTITGDVYELTHVAFGSQPWIYGSGNGLANIPNLTYLGFGGSSVSGEVEVFKNLTDLTGLYFNKTLVTGDIGYLSGLVNMTIFNIRDSEIGGDISKLYPLVSSVFVFINCPNVEFNQVVPFTLGGANFNGADCGWTIEMVDNCLISMSLGGTAGKGISIAGTNAKRSSRSDAAYDALIAAGCTITVNE